MFPVGIAVLFLKVLAFSQNLRGMWNYIGIRADIDLHPADLLVDLPLLLIALCCW